MHLHGRLGSLALLAAVAGCGGGPKDVGQLTLKDPAWDRVNVEIVVTRRADCDSRADGFIASREVPNGATVCWRRDRDPNAPATGAWSGWTRATLAPGQSADTDL